jgi:lipoprotein-releasing system permease protein
LNIRDPFSFLEVYAPNRKASSLTNPEEAFNQRLIFPAGVFSIQQEFDKKYILVSKKFAEDIFNYENRITSLEISTDPGTDMAVIKSAVSKTLGPDFQLKDRFQQHLTIYKIMKSEKWAVFLILSFILVIATFNVISSLTMLVIDKKKDIAILHSMGATKKMIRRIFLFNGLLVSVAGAAAGLLLGFLICFIQQRYGIIKLSGSGSFIIDSYPVKMISRDFIYVSLTVLFIGLIASWYPSRKLISDQLDIKAIAGEE